MIGGSGTTSNFPSYNTANAVTLGGTQTTAQRSSFGPDESTWHCTGGFGYASQTLNSGSYYGCGGGGGWYGGQKVAETVEQEVHPLFRDMQDATQLTHLQVVIKERV